MNGTRPNATLNETRSDRQGWTSSSNDRGSIDIIWSCVLTTFLCCWSVLVINVPQPRSSVWHLLYRKILLLGLCGIAPELILQIAYGQLLSAYRSVKLFRNSGYSEWTLTHAFLRRHGRFPFAISRLAIFSDRRKATTLSYNPRLYRVPRDPWESYPRQEQS